MPPEVQVNHCKTIKCLHQCISFFTEGWNHSSKPNFQMNAPDLGYVLCLFESMKHLSLPSWHFKLQSYEMSYTVNLGAGGDPRKVCMMQFDPEIKAVHLLARSFKSCRTFIL